MNAPYFWFTAWSHSRLHFSPVSAKSFLSTLCKHIKAISDWIFHYRAAVFVEAWLASLGSSSWHICRQTDSGFKLPFAAGSPGKLGNAQGVDWTGKLNMIVPKKGMAQFKGKGSRVRGWWAFPSRLHTYRNPSSSPISPSTSWKHTRTPTSTVSIFAVPVQTALLVIVWVSCLPIPACQTACTTPGRAIFKPWRILFNMWGMRRQVSKPHKNIDLHCVKLLGKD